MQDSSVKEMGVREGGGERGICVEGKKGRKKRVNGKITPTRGKVRERVIV